LIVWIRISSERIDELPADARQVAPPKCVGRHDLRSNAFKGPPHTFIRAEEERLIPPNRTTSRHAERIRIQRGLDRFSLRVTRSESIDARKFAVLVEPEPGAVQDVRP
jgi:hypothetical protein